MATRPDSPAGGRDMEEMLRDGECADAPTDVEVRPEPCALPADTPAGMRAEEPVLGGTGPGRRMSGGSEVSDVIADLGTPTPAPMAYTPNKPKIDPHFYNDMSQKELHTSCRGRGYSNRDARSLLITRLPSLYWRPRWTWR